MGRLGSDQISLARRKTERGEKDEVRSDEAGPCGSAVLSIRRVSESNGKHAHVVECRLATPLKRSFNSRPQRFFSETPGDPDGRASALRFALTTDSLPAFRSYIFGKPEQSYHASAAGGTDASTSTRIDGSGAVTGVLGSSKAKITAYICIRQNTLSDLWFTAALCRLENGSLRSISFRNSSKRISNDGRPGIEAAIGKVAAFLRSGAFKSWVYRVTNQTLACGGEAGVCRQDSGVPRKCKRCGGSEHPECHGQTSPPDKQAREDYICSTCLMVEREEVIAIRLEEQGEGATNLDELWSEARSVYMETDGHACCVCGCEDNEDFDDLVPCSCEASPAVAHPSCAAACKDYASPKGSVRRSPVPCFVCGGQGVLLNGGPNQFKTGGNKAATKRQVVPNVGMKRSMKSIQASGRGVKRSRTGTSNGLGKVEEASESEPLWNSNKKESSVQAPQIESKDTDSEKVGVALLGRRFNDAPAIVPIKKRRIQMVEVVRTPSPPPRSPSPSPCQIYDEQKVESEEHRTFDVKEEHHGSQDMDMAGELSGGASARDAGGLSTRGADDSIVKQGGDSLIPGSSKDDVLPKEGDSLQNLKEVTKQNEGTDSSAQAKELESYKQLHATDFEDGSNKGGLDNQLGENLACSSTGKEGLCLASGQGVSDNSNVGVEHMVERQLEPSDTGMEEEEMVERQPEPSEPGMKEEKMVERQLEPSGTGMKEEERVERQLEPSGTGMKEEEMVVRQPEPSETGLKDHMNGSVTKEVPPSERTREFFRSQQFTPNQCESGLKLELSGIGINTCAVHTLSEGEDRTQEMLQEEVEHDPPDDVVGEGAELELTISRPLDRDSVESNDVRTDTAGDLERSAQKVKWLVNAAHERDQGVLLRLDSGYTRDDRLHWDLNMEMEAWERPPDQTSGMEVEDDNIRESPHPLTSADSDDEGLDQRQAATAVSEGACKESFLPHGLLQKCDNSPSVSCEGTGLDSPTVSGKVLQVEDDKKCEGNSGGEETEPVTRGSPLQGTSAAPEAAPDASGAATISEVSATPEVGMVSVTVNDCSQDGAGNSDDDKGEGPKSGASSPLQKDTGEHVVNAENTLEDVTSNADADINAEAGRAEEDDGEAAYVAESFESDAYDEDEEPVSDGEKAVQDCAVDDNQGESREDKTDEWVEDAGEEPEAEEHVDYGDSDCRDADDIGLEVDERTSMALQAESDWKAEEATDNLELDNPASWEGEAVSDGFGTGQEGDERGDSDRPDESQEGENGSLKEKDSDRNECLPPQTDVNEVQDAPYVEEGSGEAQERLGMQEQESEDGIVAEVNELKSNDRDSKAEEEHEGDVQDSQMLEQRSEKHATSGRAKSTGWDQLPEGFESAEDALRAAKENSSRRGRGGPWVSSGGRGPVLSPQGAPAVSRLASGRGASSRADGSFGDRANSDELLRGRENFSHGKRLEEGLDASPRFASPRDIGRGRNLGRGGSSAGLHGRGRVGAWIDNQGGSLGQWGPGRRRSTGGFGSQGPTNAAAVAAAKVESSGFVVAPDGTITKAGGGNTQGRGGLRPMMGVGRSGRGLMVSTGRGPPIDMEAAVNFPMRVGMGPGRGMGTSPNAGMNVGRGRGLGLGVGPGLVGGLPDRGGRGMMDRYRGPPFGGGVDHMRSDSPRRSMHSLDHPPSMGRRDRSLSPRRNRGSPARISRSHTKSRSRSRTRSPRMRTPTRAGSGGMGSVSGLARKRSRSPLGLRPESRVERPKTPPPAHRLIGPSKLVPTAPGRSQRSPPPSTKWSSDKRDGDTFRDRDFKRPISRPRMPPRRTSPHVVHGSSLMDERDRQVLAGARHSPPTRVGVGSSVSGVKSGDGSSETRRPKRDEEEDGNGKIAGSRAKEADQSKISPRDASDKDRDSRANAFRRERGRDDDRRRESNKLPSKDVRSTGSYKHVSSRDIDDDIAPRRRRPS